jgi:hypothetical protein
MTEQRSSIMPPRPNRDAPRLFELMSLVAALALGIWLAMPVAKERNWVIVLTLLLGSLSAWGPPVLVHERFRRRRPITAGRLIWLVTGLASWMLWPPALLRRIAFQKDNAGTSLICFIYMAPLAGLMLSMALAIGGRLGDRKGWRTPWREAFGRWLALAWSLLGAYVLFTLYYEDFFRP